MHRDLQGRQAGGAGGIGDVIAAAEIEAVCNAPGDDIAEEAGEGAFLPFGVVALDAAGDVLHFVFRQAGLAHGIDPGGALEAACHMGGEFGGRGNAEDDAGACTVKLAAAVAFGIVERHLGGNEGEKLGCVSGLQGGRRNAEGQRIKGDRGEEAAAASIGAVRCERIGIVIVVHQPMRGRGIGEKVAAFEDVAPEAGRVAAPRKDRTDADHCDGRCRIVKGRRACLCHDLTRRQQAGRKRARRERQGRWRAAGRRG